MAPITLNLFNHTINSPTTNALMALLHGASTPKKPSAAVFNVIHIGPDKLPISILDITQLTGHVWKNISFFDILANTMCSQRLSRTILELISVVYNELPIDTTTAFIKSVQG